MRRERILEKLRSLKAAFGARGGRRISEAWTAAAARHPEIKADLAALVYEPLGADLNPTQLAYRAGARDFALMLLERMDATPDEIQHVFEEMTYDRSHDPSEF